MQKNMLKCDLLTYFVGIAEPSSSTALLPFLAFFSPCIITQVVIRA